ncbi:OR7C2 protein, partial [Atrichornis clamosus]|nr:OR7C2 protein [Atrichornis clamosus]
TAGNQTSVIVFVIMGFSHRKEMKVIFFILFLCVYIITVLGNLIILVINMDPVLHTPMYFFLRNLSFLEICYTSVTLPRMLVNL